ncbi:CxC2 domain-containing protein [Mycena kentingensis (nom. inval.)]|nr:CxC2 domain-containing protein [Mycena kentingensis (nom. inval.)]
MWNFNPRKPWKRRRRAEDSVNVDFVEDELEPDEPATNFHYHLHEGHTTRTDNDIVPAPTDDEAGLDTSAIADTVTSGNNEHHSDDDDIYEHQIPAESGKRPRYANADDPTILWREQREVILDHMIRQDVQTGRPAASSGAKNAVRRFSVAACLEERHQRTPLHVVQEWTGDFWTRAALHRLDLKDNTPQSLRLQYQLGHDGAPCPLPQQPHRLVVIDSNGIFTLDLIDNGWYPATVTELGTCVTFRALELFRLLNVCGNINAHDFVRALERLDGANEIGQTGIEPLVASSTSSPISNASNAAGLHISMTAGTPKEGEASKISICLPDWDKCVPGDEFLYALMLALDANFRLKNRIRANERQDRPYGPGWGCFVDDGPYKEHLVDYVAEEDVSTCIAFVALMQKDTRLTAGLRVSGVGGCVCARHGVIRAQGMGDLQKGERYANMDYIFMHALADARVKKLLVSYDIACQWKVNLRTRVVKILESSTIPPAIG